MAVLWEGGYYVDIIVNERLSRTNHPVLHIHAFTSICRIGIDLTYTQWNFDGEFVGEIQKVASIHD